MNENLGLKNLYFVRVCCRVIDLFGFIERFDDGFYRVSLVISVLFFGSLVKEFVFCRSGDFKGFLIVRKGLKEFLNIIDNIEI